MSVIGQVQMLSPLPLSLAERPEPPAHDDIDAGRTFKLGLVLLVVVAAAVAASLAIFHESLPPLLLNALAPLMATLVAIMLAGFPLVIGFVQAISRDRQLRKLDAIADRPVGATASYVMARSNLQAMRPASITQRDFRIPMLCFCFTVVLCSLSVCLSYSFPEAIGYRSIILGGVKVITDQPADVYTYQGETFTAIGYAFFGAYISVIHRFLGRISNNDVYPVSFHIYTAWILSAGVIAGVIRQVLDMMGPHIGPSGLILIGFVTGLSPNLFAIALARRAFSLFKIIGDKADPAAEQLPTNMNLLMIDGIATEQSDRLAELGVANAQILAAQNPFTLWPRLPYDLGLLVNWIAQAQLYMRVREEGFHDLRACQIGDIFDFETALAEPAAQAAVCDLLKLPRALAPTLLASIDADPFFVRLKAVRVAMSTS